MRTCLAALVVLSCSNLLAQVCSAGAFPATDPVTISGTVNVSNGCILNFGARHVILAGNCNLLVQNVTIQCAKFTMLPSSQINGSNGGSITLNVTAGNGWDGAVSVAGTLDNDDPLGGGTTTITCDGGFEIVGSGRVRARGTTASGCGGSIAVSSGGLILVDGAIKSIDVTSGNDAFGGAVILNTSAGNVDVRRTVDASGGSFGGGCIDLIATSHVSVSGRLNTDGGGGSVVCFGDGGIVTIAAPGTVTIRNDITANGPAGTSGCGGGWGGFIAITSGGDMVVSGNIRATGGQDGLGGDICINCGGNYSQMTGELSVRDTATDGEGGTIDISVGGDILLNDVDAAGSSSSFGFGGTITVESMNGDVTAPGAIACHGNWAGCVDLCAPNGQVFLGGGQIIADGRGGAATGGIVNVTGFAGVDVSGALIDVTGASTSGLGGSVNLSSTLHVTGDPTTDIRASGNGSNGACAGDIIIDGCDVFMPNGSKLWARGALFGSVQLTAGNVLLAGGDFRADAGSVIFRTRLDAPFSPVITTGSLIVPPPVVVHDPTMPPCLSVQHIAVTTNSPIAVGVQATLEFQSKPLKPILVIGDLFPGYVSLGAQGYTQINPFSPTSFILADPGFIVTLPNSATDAQGRWTFTSAPIPPGLTGFVIFFEGYVIDANAPNGFFHQSQLARWVFQ